MGKRNDATGKVTVYRLKTMVADLASAKINECDRVSLGTESKSELEYSLWMGDFRAHAPHWFAPFKDIVAETKAPKVRQAGFVMLVNTNTATYACTGGLGYHRLMDSYQIEPRFGLVVAKKVLATHELKGLIQKDASGIVNNLDRMFRGVYNPEGDIDNLHRVLKSLRASFDKASQKYQDIGSSIRAGDSLSVNKSRDFEGIFAFVQQVDTLWKSTDTGLKFPELEHISKKHEKDLLGDLNRSLAERIRNAHQKGSSVELPLFLDNVGMGYLPDRVVEYTVCYNRKWKSCDSHEAVFDEVGRILAESSTDGTLLHTVLESIKIKLKFDDDYVGKYRAILDYVCGDLDFGQDTYFISNGLWYRANADFIDRVNGELNEVEFISPDDLSLQDWTENGQTAEGDYNLKHAQHGLVVLDRRKVQVDVEKGKIEFCDLLRVQGDDVHLIHVKHAWGAELRALLAQGYVSAQLYSESTEFRTKVCGADVESSDALSSGDKQVLAGLINIPKRQITVVYAIFDDKSGHVPSIDHPTTIGEGLNGTMTLFPKIDLLGRVQAIRAMGFQVAVTRIKPYPETA
jgi:uncharacterized protein (TIGR04141 family)